MQVQSGPSCMCFDAAARRHSSAGTRQEDHTVRSWLAVIQVTDGKGTDADGDCCSSCVPVRRSVSLNRLTTEVSSAAGRGEGGMNDIGRREAFESVDLAP